jgi:hypothetical protein
VSQETDPGTERVVGRLTASLEPVRRIPRLRSVAVMALAVAALIGALAVGVRGLRADVRALEMTMPWLAVLVGLSLLGVGALVAALGSSVPGREGTTRAGGAGATLGLLLAAGAGFALLVRAMGMEPVGAHWAWEGLVCLASAGAVAVVPGVLLGSFVHRAAPQRPIAALSVAAGAALALGAVAVHLSCPSNDARHLLLFHVGAPAAGAAICWLSLRALRSGRR